VKLPHKPAAQQSDNVEIAELRQQLIEAEAERDQLREMITNPFRYEDKIRAMRAQRKAERKAEQLAAAKAKRAGAQAAGKHVASEAELQVEIEQLKQQLKDLRTHNADLFSGPSRNEGAVRREA
jgi:hypothetical protein